MSAHSTGLRTPIPDSEIASVHFFNGRLVTSGDLALEQESQRLADQRIGSAIGAGIVEGLGIEFVSTDTQNGTLLRVDAGSGITAKGSALKLETEVELRIAAPSQKTSTTSGKAVFCKCATAPIWSRSAPPPSGAYLLVLRPDRQERGKRSLVGTDLSHLGCDTDTIAAAVQFDLVPVDISGIVADSPARLRHELAQRSLRQSTPGQDDVLPLALVHFAVDTRLSFLDMWAVRRTTGRSRQIMSRPFLAPHPDAKLAWSDLVGDIPDSLGEARLCQFQDELDTALSSGSGAILSSDFLPLPSAGFLPLEHARLEWRDFLGAHAASAPETLPVLEPTLVGPIVAEAATRDPLDTGSRVRVAKVAGRDLVVYFRESINRTIASETWFDGKSARIEAASNVQTAIEKLNMEVKAIRAIWVKPGPGWEKAIPPAGTKSNVDLDLRFTVGEYPSTSPVLLKGYRHVVLKGAGNSSLIRSEDESALVIEGAESCLVEDLSFASGKVVANRNQSEPGLVGAISIKDVRSTNLYRVRATCPSGGILASSAISVHNLSPQTNSSETKQSIRIVDCVALAGCGQQGILCVDPSASILVKDNIVARLPGSKPILESTSTTRWIDRISNVMLGRVKGTPLADSIQSRLPSNFRQSLQQFSKGLEQPDKAQQTVFNRIKRASRRAMQKNARGSQFSGDLTLLAQQFAKERDTLLARGIVVAAKTLNEVRISGNRIESTARGIWVAVSKHSKPRNGLPQIRELSIEGNIVSIPEASSEPGIRCGIFVGNVESVSIDSNRIDIGAQDDRRSVEGIRVFGATGRFLRIVGNRISGAEPGIWFRHVDTNETVPKGRSRSWTIASNLAAESRTVVQFDPKYFDEKAPSPLRLEDNIP